MHMYIEFTDGERRCIPLFGLNAPNQLGVLMVTARTGSDSGVVAVLPFAPLGTVQTDQSIILDEDPTGLALVQTTLVAEGGFCFDGISLSDVQYLYCEGGTVPVDPSDPEGDTRPRRMYVDVNFTPNRIPVATGDQ